MTPRLLLWDVDHTLVELGRLHYDLYREALIRVFGTTPTMLPDMAGRTDRDSSTEYLAANGVEPTPEALRHFWNGLVTELHRRPGITASGHVLPGALEVVTRLSAVPNVHQSVLTGNLRRLAVDKLTPFGFAPVLDLAVGGYGEDDTDRARLVGRARERMALRHGICIAADHVVLIGDTPLDVTAAHRSGARVVAVATGRSSEDALRAAGADAVLPDLALVDRAMETILRVVPEDDDRESRGQP